MSEPLQLPQAPDDPALAPVVAVNPLSYAVTAFVFFALGFLLAGVLGADFFGPSAEESVQSVESQVAQAVQGTLIALTPTPTPRPTTVPIALTFSERDYSLGNPEAPITIVEFSDYRCPYCAAFYAETLQPLLAHYEGYVRFIYRDFPIFGAESLSASGAAFCAHQQGKFWDYHALLFESQLAAQRSPLAQADLLGFAETLELEMATFRTCLEDEATTQGILQNFSSAIDLLGENTGTPTFLINGERYVGARPLQSFIAIIDQMLLALGVQPPT